MKPISIVPEVKQEDMLFIVTVVTSERTEVVMDGGEGDESGGLVRVIFRSAPNNVRNSDGFIRHEGTKVGDQSLISWTDARRVVGSGQKNVIGEWVGMDARRCGVEVYERIGDIGLGASLCGHRFGSVMEGSVREQGTKWINYPLLKRRRLGALKNACGASGRAS
jgi:hypothetical protein